MDAIQQLIFRFVPEILVDVRHLALGLFLLVTLTGWLSWERRRG
jgi:hypothetical protein